MTFDYGRFKATADRLLARFGQPGILRRPTASGTAYNPTAGSPQDYACTLVVDAYSNRDVDGTRVRATDKKVLLATGALAIEPATADKLVIGGVEHTIERVEPLAPGGVTVMWTLQVRH